MKIINLILGLGTAIIVGSLIYLGIQTFYPAPEYPEYPGYPYPEASRSFNCNSNDFRCLDEEQAYYDQQDRQRTDQSKEYDKKVKEYDEKSEAYGRNFFIIANITGLIVFIGGFLLLFATTMANRSIPIGIMLAGMASIISGYATGWGGTDDKIKFVVGLLIAIIVIGGSMWLMQRYQRKDAQFPSQAQP